MAEGHEAHVKITGESSSLERAAGRSAQKVREFDESLTRAEVSSKKANAAIENTAKSSQKLGTQLVKLKGDFNGAMEIIKKAVGFIDQIAASQVAAGEGTDIFTRSWLRMRSAMDDPKFFARISSGLADILTQLDPMQQMVDRVSNKGATGVSFLGDNRRGLGLRGLAIQGRRGAGQLVGEEQQRGIGVQMGLLGSLKAGTEALDKYAESHKRTAAAVKKDSEEMLAFKRALAEAHNEINIATGLDRASGDTRDLEAARLAAHNAAVGAQIQRRTPIDTAVQQQQADQALNAQMRAIELARAQDENGIGEIGRIEEERAAKEAFFREQAANTDDYITRLQALEQVEQTNHLAKLARIEAERAARARATAQIINAAETTAGVIGAGTRIAAMAAEASGASAKKQARAAQIGMGIQAMAIGALEVVKAAASYASLNIPQGIAHTAAAAVAFTEGGLLLAGKIGGGASAGGGGGRGVESSGSSPGAGGTSTPIGSNSQIPGSPGPQAPTSSGAPQNTGGGAVIINLTGANFYGTGGKKEFGRFVDEALQESSQNRRARRDVG